MSDLSSLATALKQHDNFLICGHEHPDPDSLGSMVALYWALDTMGKRAVMMSSDPIPANLRWSGLELILPYQDDVSFDAAIVLDCQPERTGEVAKIINGAKVVFNIDHHQGNPGDGDYNYLDPKEPATAVMIYKLIAELGMKTSLPIAEAIYAGILGDTGGFRHANTSAEVLQIASDLVNLGVNPTRLYRDIFERKSWEFMKLLGHALNRLQRSEDNRLVWLTLSHQDFLEFGTDPTQSDQLVQYVRMVDGCQIAIIFRETAPAEIRVGFRSVQADVGSLAREFGGGGHFLASGAKLTGELAEVVPLVIAKATSLLAQEESL